jgi:predicted TIM-barrel fold metal-dependent hydrolase
MNEITPPDPRPPMSEHETYDPGGSTDIDAVVVDTDTHCGGWATAPTGKTGGLFAGNAFAGLYDYLPSRWTRWLDRVGVRGIEPIGQIPRGRAFVHRLDSVPPAGGAPGSDPEFAREQLLDRFNLTGALLNLPAGLVSAHDPVDLGIAFARAENEQLADRWLASDSRWYGSINIAVESSTAAIHEIDRCVDSEPGRWVQLMLSSRADYPLGNPRYWPVFEAAVAHDLPLGIHPGINRNTQLTGCGTPSYYFEEHAGFAYTSYSLVASLIFEGVFDRFPDLKVVLIELGWGWAPAYAQRLDASWRVMRDEVPDLAKKPSEYLRDHFWFTTQPVEEPENPAWFAQLFGTMESAGLAERLMFSSDYPHWDFDSPEDALPPTLSPDDRSRIMGATACALYGIPVDGSAAPTTGRDSSAIHGT